MINVIFVLFREPLVPVRDDVANWRRANRTVRSILLLRATGDTGRAWRDSISRKELAA